MKTNMKAETLREAVKKQGILVKSLGAVGKGEYGEDVMGFELYVMKVIEDGENTRYFPHHVIMEGEHVFTRDGGGYNKAESVVSELLRMVDPELANQYAGKNSHYYVI